MIGIFGYYGQTIDENKILKGITNTGYNIREISVTPKTILGSLNIASDKKNTTIETKNGITIVTCGEIYNEDIPDLRTTILNFHNTGDLECLKKLNGSYAVALYDEKKEKLILINDRYGTIKLFYNYDKDHFSFSPKIKPLIQWGAKKTLRKEAIFDFFLFRYMLSDKTFFEEIHQLPPASILEISNDGMKLTQYWTYQLTVKYDSRSEEELIEELRKRWQKSVERRIKKNEQIIIPLSGGLDSRAILAAALRHTSKDNIITYTFGEKESYDFQIGQKIADITGVKNIAPSPKKMDFEQQYTISMHDIEGMIDATPYFPIDSYLHLQNHATTICSGHMGGELMGPLIFSKIRRKKLDTKKRYETIKKIFFNHHKLHDPQDIQSLFNNDYFKNENILKSFEDSIIDFKNISKDQVPNFCAAWLYNQETDKYTAFCNLRYRNLFRYSLPFLDNDLVDFMLQVPPRLRDHKRLYKTMLVKTYPDLFTLPTKNTYGYTLTTNNISIILKRGELFLQRKINSISNHLLGKDLFFYKTQNFLNYDNLLRTNKEYQEYMKKMINRVKLRKYFNPEYIEELWQLHIKGKKNYAMLFGLLVTFELFLENFVDDENITDRR